MEQAMSAEKYKYNRHCVHDPCSEEKPASVGNEDFGMKTGVKMEQQRKMLLLRLGIITVTVLIGGFMFSTIGPQGGETDSSTDPDHYKKLQDFLKAANSDWKTFTYSQLQQWYDAQVPDNLKFEVFPRLYPFCVTAKQVGDTSRTNKADHIYRFLDMFKEIELLDEKYHKFQVDKHSTAKSNKWIKEITISRINTPEMDMVNLRQWVHIRVRTNGKMKGLYMQSIVGPLGLPFGEFYLDFPCQDAKETDDMNSVGQLSYCSYRPRAGIEHPSVYVGYDENGKDEFHMHFYYTDITCLETPYIQFLFLVVKDFKNAESTMHKNWAPQFSPIYTNTDFDSKSGAPSPYYPEWRDRMYCYFKDNTEMGKVYATLFPGDKDPMSSDDVPRGYNAWPSDKDGADKEFAKINWKVSTVAYRIQPNEQYDAYIIDELKDKDKHLRNEDRLECPPGPFQCDTALASKPDVQKERDALVKNEEKLSQCVPCGAPPCLQLGFPSYKCDGKADSITIHVNESIQLSRVESFVQGNSHGTQAMFAFLVLVPVSNFMARFYKEVCGKFLCGNGPWIFFHIGSHVVSLMFMWISVGPVIPKLTLIKNQSLECSTLHPDDNAGYKECVYRAFENPHVPLAFLAFFFQHILVGTGFWRVGSNKMRTVQVAIHSHLGYGCWILGSISVIVIGVKRLCPVMLIFSGLALMTPLIFSSLGVALDCVTDRKIGIIPPRSQYPVLEQVKLQGKGPLTVPKWIVFGIYTVLMIAYWALAVGENYTIVSGNDQLFENDNKTGLIGSFFEDKCKGSLKLNETKVAERYETIT